MTEQAYAPYSNFHVGAVAKLENGEIVAGTNQENASYPVGICAERVLLGSAATLHPDVAIESIAISYNSEKVKSDHPISPCGMCRQSLLEYENGKKTNSIDSRWDGRESLVKRQVNCYRLDLQVMI